MPPRIEPTRQADRGASAAIVAASLVVSGVFIGQSAFSVGGRTYFSLFDDAMISMQYARNLAEGHGLVWNTNGPRVEGYTNLLWTLWMAVLHLLRIPEATVSLAVMVSGALLLVANLFLVREIARLLARGRLVPLVAMALTAAYYPLIFWTLRGMEVGLMTTLVSAGVLLALRVGRGSPRRRDIVLLTAAIAAAVLTRTDGFVPMLPIVAYVGVFRRRLAPVVGGALALPFVAQTAFREAYYHALVPNTYTLKVAGVPLGDRLGRGALSMLELAVAHLWLPLIVAGALLVLCRRRDREAWLLGSVVVVLLLYSVYVGGDAWEWTLYSNRYVTPAIPLLLILVAAGLTELLSRRRELQVMAAVAAGAALVLAISYARIFPSGDQQPTGLGNVGPQLYPALAAIAWTLNVASSRLRRRRGLSAGRVVPVTLALLLLVAVDGTPVSNWLGYGAVHVENDANAARYGLAIRAGTVPTATIAVVWAGAIPYFAHRQSVDLLGKSDRTIAKTASRKPFYPGHSKWDYAYSIEGLRPDVVAQLWRPSADDRVALRRWGYIRIARNLYVRSGSGALLPRSGAAVAAAARTAP